VTNGRSISKVTDYNRVMDSANGQKAGHAELNSVGELFSECMFKVHKESSITIIDYGFGHIIHNLLFTENLDDGHYSTLKNKSDIPISIIPVKKLECVGKICPLADSNGTQNEVVVLEVKRLKRKATLTGVRERGVNVRRKKDNKIGGEKFLKVALRCAVSDVISNVRTCRWSSGSLSTLLCIVFQTRKKYSGALHSLLL